MTGEKTPAIFVNLFQIAVQNDGIVRIVFSDAVQGMNGNERAAIVMSVENAKMLHEAIAQTLQQASAKTSSEA